MKKMFIFNFIVLILFSLLSAREVKNFRNMSFITDIKGDDKYILAGTRNGLAVIDRWTEEVVNIPEDFVGKHIKKIGILNNTFYIKLFDNSVYEYNPNTDVYFSFSGNESSIDFSSRPIYENLRNPGYFKDESLNWYTPTVNWLEPYSKKLWVGTSGYGIFIYDLITNDVTVHLIPPEDAKHISLSFASNKFYYAKKIENEIILIGTNQNELIVELLDLNMKKIDSFRSDKLHFNFDLFEFMYYNKILFFLSDEFFFMFDLDAKKLDYFRITNLISISQHENLIFLLDEVSKLYMFDYSIKKMISLNQEIIKGEEYMKGIFTFNDSLYTYNSRKIFNIEIFEDTIRFDKKMTSLIRDSFPEKIQTINNELLIINSNSFITLKKNKNPVLYSISYNLYENNINSVNMNSRFITINTNQGLLLYDKTYETYEIINEIDELSDNIIVYSEFLEKRKLLILTAKGISIIDNL